jgi:GNAT superfamily N-acetyltransferase
MNGIDTGLVDLADEVAKWVETETHAAVGRGEAVLAQKAERVLAQIQNGQAVVAFVDGQVVGFITTYHLGKTADLDWFEVGTAYVAPAFRRQRIGHELFRRIAEKHPEGVLMATTKNPTAQFLCATAGLDEADYAVVPTEIRKGLCYQAPCFIGDPVKRGPCASECRHGGNCGLYVRWVASQ